MKYLPLIWRNLVRDKLRSFLTAAAIAVAICLVCVLRTMPSGLEAIVNDVTSDTRVLVQNRAGPSYTLPYAYFTKVREMPGVTSAASWTWLGGVAQTAKGRSVMIGGLAVEPEAVGEVWAEYPIRPEALQQFRRQRDAAIVGRAALLQCGWKVGDLVTLHSTVFDLDISFRIVGEIEDLRAPYFWLQRAYAEQVLLARGVSFDFASFIWVRVQDPDRVIPLMQEIDALFRNSEAPTASETERSYFTHFVGMLRGAAMMILIVTGVVTLCTVFLAANTASMSIRERFAEIAVLRAIGFDRRHVFGMLLAEMALLSTLAGAVGTSASLGLTIVLQTYVKGWSDEFGPLAHFVVTDAIVAQGLLLGLLVGLVAGLVPSLGAARRSAAATMREVF